MLAVGFSPIPYDIVVEKLSQCGCFVTIVLDELVQVVCHSEKPLKSCLVFWCWHVSNCICLLCVRFQTFIRERVPHEGDASRPQLAFAEVQLQANLSSSLQDFPEVGIMFFFSRTPDKDVVDNDCAWLSFSMACWSTSDAVLMPKGMRRNLYLPYGVLNVVRREDCFSSLIFQNPAFASNIEKTFAFPRLEATSSAVRMG